MAQGLFREEVLRAQRGSWLGSISLAQPIPLWILTAVAVAAAFAIAAFFVLGSYTQRSRVAGRLVPEQGLATVVTPSAGLLGHTAVTEGQRVRAGQLLAVVSVPRATPSGGDTAAALEAELRQRKDSLTQSEAAQALQLDAQEDGLKRQIANVQRQLAQLDAEIATRRGQVALARETLDRMRQLQQQKYVSELELKQRESAVLGLTGDMQLLQRQSVETRRQLAQLQQALQELPAQRQLGAANYRRDLAMLEQERVETGARAELALVAPADGVVATLVLKIGQTVQAGQPVMTVIPGDGRLEAELLVPSRAIGFIAPGDRVLLRYQAFPYQKFGHHPGRVVRISRSALSPDELNLLIGQANAGEPYYRITVALAHQAVVAYGKAESLKPGMLLEADVLGERRRLMEWVFEPLYSLKGRVLD